jgi:hypothetical protein
MTFLPVPSVRQVTNRWPVPLWFQGNQRQAGDTSGFWRKGTGAPVRQTAGALLSFWRTEGGDREGSNPHSCRLLLTTNAELKAMAAAAIRGDQQPRSRPRERSDVAGGGPEQLALDRARGPLHFSRAGWGRDPRLPSAAGCRRERCGAVSHAY